MLAGCHRSILHSVRLLNLMSSGRSFCRLIVVTLFPDQLMVLTRFSLKFIPRKSFYFHLCHNPILIDGSTKSFSLEKGTGKKCFMLASRDLIIWGCPPRWQWISFPNSRFPEVGVRLVGYLFAICGKINTSMLSSGTKYAAYLLFTLRSGINGYGHHLARALIVISGQNADEQTNYLQIGQEADGTTVYCPDEEQRQRCQTVPRPKTFLHLISHVFRRLDIIEPSELHRYPKFRDDGWMEVEMGEFFVEGKQDQDVKIISVPWNPGLWCNCWHGGHLIIQGADPTDLDCGVKN
ncbi:Hypothetical predicted protein [Olea europaea subsp. europaea]|uniref:Uncharacterized protein n=1 Tax=Olea europaea subsp. europaea TaxID=158383 RepID=A0A8S0V0G3_OLEEU|nr:Hypothetical predicted protein [Olea europaea subsp. europaea]